MSKSLVAFAALVGIAIAAPLPAQAQAQQACGKRADIIKHLAGQYQESPVAIGLADNGSLVEILASTDGATWTLIFSLPTGTSCLVATGQDWQTAPRIAELGPPA
jgi:hypothetical protein